MVLRLYEQRKKDGLEDHVIRKDIEASFNGVLTERRIRGLLPLELKRSYTVKPKANSEIISDLQRSTKAVTNMAANAVVKIAK
jgi:hypothetical protein